ncbi:MAG: glycosyltransferase family 87 protein [Acidimicrobiales bacterium]
MSRETVAEASTGAGSSAADWMRRLSLIAAGVLVVMLITWILDDPIENLSTDWTAFDRAADRAWAGERVYRPFDAESESLPYLYPPFALVLALPLALVGFYGSFAFSASLTFAAFVSGVVMVVRRREIDRATAVIVASTTGAVITSTLIGQYSGLYVLALGAMAAFLVDGRERAAGAALALLWLKPNLAIAIPVVLVWSRSWRMLGSWAAVSVGVFASSLPFGLDRWRGFADNVSMMAELQADNIVPVDKMVTIQAAIQQGLGLESSSPLLWGMWALAILPLGLSVLAVWSREALLAAPMRAVGVLALFIVAANVRLYFYDAVLVAFGLLSIHAERDRFCIDRLSRAIGPLTMALWIGLWGGVWLPLNMVVGPIAGVVIIVVGLDTHLRSRRVDAADAFGDGAELGDGVSLSRAA